MKRTIVMFALIMTLSFVTLNVVSAQETALPNPTQEVDTQPVLPQSEEDLPEEEEENKDTGITEDNQQSFINGVIVGAIVGLVLGGTGAWIFRKRVDQI